MAHRLHPPALEQLGLAAALRSLCSDFSGMYPIKLNFAERKVPRSLPLGIALCLYRVTQECLHNVAKHSGASEATVRLERSKNHIRLSICDNGKGFLPHAVENSRGLGLAGIRERLRILRGTVSIAPDAGQGACIEVEIPWRGKS
jgi:signal transduction histidine kinase